MNAPIQSLLGSIFKMHRDKEISDDEFLLANATYVEQHTREYILSPVNDPPGNVMAYLDARLSGREYDYEKAHALGDWFFLAYRLIDQNSSNASLFVWAAEILDKHSLPHPKIDIMLDYYNRECRHPSRYADALEVKRKDAQTPTHMKGRR